MTATRFIPSWTQKAVVLYYFGCLFDVLLTLEIKTLSFNNNYMSSPHACRFRHIVASFRLEPE